MDLTPYLQPTYFLDSDNPAVQKFATEVTLGLLTDVEKAVALYYKVRDGFHYVPYHISLKREALKASAQLKQKNGYCVQKAALLVAACRAVGIPARLQFFIVKNHLGTGELEKALKTDLIVFHGGAQIYLEGRWLKVVPAFDKRLCERLHVAPLEFDGHHDSCFQEFIDAAGTKKFMEYVHDYGTFADFPLRLAMQELRRYYPSAFDEKTPQKDRVVFIDWEPT
jgi:transglutaminase-like putative cysteine protease